ncbi:hypothetical protein [Polyangium aurulentum]|uniref:hypothetical protein n=1 Tax=Polyangium aurulentum TaxID=2567896 RepID=UPI0010AE0DDD|nr:hypothetical protein [Polyangium aurulentum]UQA56397.1 hypothetical protein E8A73_034535 [Polyangium aurulentum]
MSAPNLSRRIASSIVEGLKARGRILVVKGETAALVREVDGAMAGEIDKIAPSLGGPGEPAEAREALERLVDRVVEALLGSEHLEDVFAERALVRREAESAARAAVRESREVEEEESVRVSLDMLGYVAATASKRARPEALRGALERAGHLSGARLGGYDEGAREATFIPEAPGDPDLRLTLEEAVADELTELVESGEVDLPTIERTVTLALEVSPDLRVGLKRRIDVAAARTLRRTGCAASWEFASGKTLRVAFTPLSEHDARDVDDYLAEFTREVNASLAEVPAPAPAPPAPAEAPREAAPPPPPPVAAKEEPAPRVEPVEPVEEQAAPALAEADAAAGANGTTAHADESEGEEEAAPPSRERQSKRASRTSTRPPASPRTGAKRTAAKRTTTKRAAAASEEPARKKTAAKKRALPSTSKTRSTPSKKR